MATVSRNAPCICGSGKKYKHCCLGKPAAARSRRPRLLLPVILALAGIAAGASVAAQGNLGAGISMGAGALIIAGLVWLLHDPPPPGKSGDPGAINFGG